MSLDLDDIQYWVDDNKILLGFAACAIALVAGLATGGMSSIQETFAANGKKDLMTTGQTRAEELFNAGQCSAQVLNRKTRSNSLQPGDIAIDPMSVTANNPDGTPINGGCVVIPDGSVFYVREGGRVELVGTSSAIRNTFIEKGFAAKTKEMESGANQIYNETYNVANPNPGWSIGGNFNDQSANN